MENDCSPCGSDIEPTSEAWKALNKTLKAIDLAALGSPHDGLNWKLDENQKQLRPKLGANLQRRRTRFSAGLRASNDRIPVAFPLGIEQQRFATGAG